MLTGIWILCMILLMQQQGSVIATFEDAYDFVKDPGGLFYRHHHRKSCSFQWFSYWRGIVLSFTHRDKYYLLERLNLLHRSLVFNLLFLFSPVEFFETIKRQKQVYHEIY